MVGQYDLLNQALGALLVNLPCIEVAGQVQSFEEISSQSLSLEPCVILWVLPASKDLEALSKEQQHLSGKVLLFSMGWKPENVKESLKAGAAGCLPANISLAELADAIRQVNRGETYLPPDIARDLYLDLLKENETPAGPSFDSLTPKERELLPLLCQGLSNKQIAQNLYLSVRTVENHLASIYGKLGASSRTEAAVLVLQQNWI